MCGEVCVVRCVWGGECGCVWVWGGGCEWEGGFGCREMVGVGLGVSVMWEGVGDGFKLWSM